MRVLSLGAMRWSCVFEHDPLAGTGTPAVLVSVWNDQNFVRLD